MSSFTEVQKVEATFSEKTEERTPEQLWERMGVRATLCCQFGGGEHSGERSRGEWGSGSISKKKAIRAVAKHDRNRSG